MEGSSRGKLYIGLIAIATVLLVIYRAFHPDPYVPGDWLINYTAGFVRRGLTGEALLLVAHTFRLPVVLLGSLLPLLFYGAMYLFFWRLWPGGNLWASITLISPATLAFPILSSGAASHKEILLFALLAGLLFWFKSGRPTDAETSAYTALAVVAILLCHEGLAPYLIYFAAAIWLATGNIRRTVRVLIIPFVLGVATLYVVRHHIGDASMERAICSSLSTRNPEICGGAIAYLSKVPRDAHLDVLAAIHQFHYWFYYPLLVLLSIAPLVAMLKSVHAMNRNILLLSGAAASLTSGPLFYYGADWGRWIYIHVMCLFLLILFVLGRQRVVRQRPVRIKGWALAAVIVYATCWNMPYGGDNVKKGYLNVPLHFLRSRHTQVSDSGLRRGYHLS